MAAKQKILIVDDDVNIAELIYISRRNALIQRWFMMGNLL